MKKKYIVIGLLSVGVGLMVLSVVLTIMAAKNVSIIGGVGWPTLWVLFTTRNRGLYFLLARLGIYAVLSAIVVGLIKKKSK